MLTSLALVFLVGLSLNLDDLKKVGRPAVLMAFLPALLEILAFVLFAPPVFGIDRIEAAIMGAVLMIAAGLLFRCAGVWLCMAGTPLNRGERLYCMIAYLPKATVQAAIGSVPLALGLPCGNLVLSVAVLSILITAPLGAAGMDLTCADPYLTS